MGEDVFWTKSKSFSHDVFGVSFMCGGKTGKREITTVCSSPAASSKNMSRTRSSQSKILNCVSMTLQRCSLAFFVLLGTAVISLSWLPSSYSLLLSPSKSRKSSSVSTTSWSSTTSTLPSTTVRLSSTSTSSSSSTLITNVVGSANLDWPNLGFEYRDADCFVTMKYANGQWGPVEIATDPMIKIHIGATALHYGQACFEGLKAFHTKDGKVCIFRPTENADRIAKSCVRICMPPLPEEKFLEAVKTVVKENLRFLPPFGTNGAMYIRPLLYGSGPRIGLQPAAEYTFVCMVLPVADYYKGGLKPVPAIVADDYDRAAPRGVGSAKVAGNYAADLLPNTAAKKNGYPIVLYLDAKTNSLVEEFSTSNFLAIDQSGAYVTPKSEAILASITNKSLQQLAAAEGMDVQVRPVGIEEVMAGKFREVAACGTAVVVTPVDRIVYKDRVATISNEGVGGVGPVIKKLYDRVRGIQNGEEQDPFGWMMEI